MKKLIFITELIIFISGASFARTPVAEGKTFTALRNFKIETADLPLINSNSIKNT